jgi:hypothetical protein
LIDTLLYATTGIAVVGALSAWACTRNQAARLRDLQDRIDDALAAMAQPAEIVAEPSTVHLPSVSEDVHKQLLESIRTHRAEFVNREIPVGHYPNASGPAATAALMAKHPLYAKTGLPNQPVASLRPDTPKPTAGCPRCGDPQIDDGQGVKRCTGCGAWDYRGRSDGGVSGRPLRKCENCGESYKLPVNAVPVCPNCGD